MGRFGKGSPRVHLHRGKGVPLEGPFLGCFSQGNLTEMNENAHFSVFRIFCDFDPFLLGHFRPQNNLVSERFLPIFHPVERFSMDFQNEKRNQEWG